ncbi:uncharacterized protein LOC124125511 [Haliotis rufescens]|uniref:uncharacterized protein LOC124125511 n=1 Tax=Haliotis rufescens TaxID=6454 RepID=UPI00201E78BF|nr:uncharacterized protein LOC124125511 [Haliotis rufescens]XP_046344791.2 uncharacterized protein LOC124125511 [Haliotis rufescens]XP_048247700.1 uncharacterized protein LOC124125511 [Haliotis rufescens]
MGIITSKNRFLELRKRPLSFSDEHDDHITVSEDKRTAHWGLDTSQSDASGRCYSNRTLHANELVRMSVRGSGFFDLGLTDVHPAQLHSNRDFIFKCIVSKVLYFDPVILEFYITPEGNVCLTDGRDPEVNIALGTPANTHWLAMKLGCGEITVSFLSDGEAASSSESSSESESSSDTLNLAMEP